MCPYMYIHTKGYSTMCGTIVLAYLHVAFPLSNTYVYYRLHILHQPNLQRLMLRLGHFFFKLRLGQQPWKTGSSHFSSCWFKSCRAMGLYSWWFGKQNLRSSCTIYQGKTPELFPVIQEMCQEMFPKSREHGSKRSSELLPPYRMAVNLRHA